MAGVTTRAVAYAEPKWREMYGNVVSSAFRSLRSGTVGIASAKASIIELLTIEPVDGGLKPWQSFVIRNSDGALLVDTTSNPHKTFREFVEAQPLRGLGESVADIERLLADEPEALARLREELTAKEWERNPTGRNQHSEVMTNNVSHNQEPDLFTEPPAKPKRERNTEHGNRKDYTLSRLKKDAPELFEKVKAGELSANAAALQAGFRRQMRSIPVDSPENAIRALQRIFSSHDLLRQLVNSIPSDAQYLPDIAKDVLLALTADELAQLLADETIKGVVSSGMEGIA